jgi:hypothetical protein
VKLSGQFRDNLQSHDNQEGCGGERTKHLPPGVLRKIKIKKKNMQNINNNKIILQILYPKYSKVISKNIFHLLKRYFVSKSYGWLPVRFGTPTPFGKSLWRPMYYLNIYYVKI